MAAGIAANGPSIKELISITASPRFTYPSVAGMGILITNVAIKTRAVSIPADAICLICFLVIPTTMVRHDLTATDFLSRWVQSVYDIDAADNLFPSIHCLESYVLTRGAFKMERCPAWYKWGSIPVTILVFLSTLFMRQHVIADVISAVAAVEIGFLVMGLWKRYRKNYPRSAFYSN